MKRSIHFIILIIISVIASSAYSGNPEVIHPVTGESIGWADSQAVPYWLDQGPLGELTNLQAKALTGAMLSLWSSVETADVGFSYQGDLPDDVTIDNIEEYLAMTTCGTGDRTDIPQNVVPIVFDTDGQIIEYIAGLGSSVEVGGLSTLRCFRGTLEDPESIYQGMVVINGQFNDGLGANDDSPEDLSVNGLAGIILHETGHLIGLDHSVVNTEVYQAVSNGGLPTTYTRFLPVMMPTVLRESQAATTLHPDDISSLSSLYPTASYADQVGNIEGEILDLEGGEVRKVNVVARRNDDPLCEAVSSISGRRCVPIVDTQGRPNFNMTSCSSSELYGDYLIEGLVPGDYSVEVEELTMGWMSHGMYPVGIEAGLPGDAEYYNTDDKGREESPFEMSLVDVVAGDNTFGIDIVLSDTSDKIDQYDTIPLEKISEGPGTRCLIDSIDYGVALQSEDLDLFSLSGSESLEVASPSGGGCQLAINGRTNYWAILIFLGLIVFIGGLRMKRHIFWVLILSTLFLSSVAMATSVVPVDLKTLATKAEKIFYGRCADVDVQEDENGLRSTYVTFEIERGVKGADGNAVTFKIFGEAPKEGNGFSTGIIGMPHFQEGDLHVLFLYPESAGGYTSPVGLGQGSFRAVETEAGPKLVNKKLSVQDKTMKEVVGNDVPETPDELLDRVEDLLN